MYRFGKYRTKLDKLNDEKGTEFYYIGDGKKKDYLGQPINLSEEVIFKCIDYAFDMAKQKKQRENRNGGQKKRDEYEIFWDDFRGKIAECYY